MNDMTLAAQDQATMSSREISEATGKRHPDVKRDIEKMATDLGQDVSIFAHIYLDSMNREQTEYRLDRFHTEVLVTGYDTKRRAAVIKRWHDLESGKAQPIAIQQPSVAELVQAADVMASALRLEGTARITALRSFSAANCPQLLPMMPDYAIDAPTVAGGATSSLPTASASSLLKSHGTGITTAYFNKVCHSQGLLEKRSRTNSKGKEVSFWCLTQLGLEYGKNVTSPQSPLQTQPHWYEDRFADLLQFIGFDKAA